MSNIICKCGSNKVKVFKVDKPLLVSQKILITELKERFGEVPMPTTIRKNTFFEARCRNYGHIEKFDKFIKSLDDKRTTKKKRLLERIFEKKK